MRTSFIRVIAIVAPACAFILLADNTMEKRVAAHQLGSVIQGLTGNERELFRKGFEAFTRVNSVQGDAYVRDTELGLGPLFNLDSCGGCHAHPAPGGTSPKDNPQIGVATREGAKNKIPFFLHPNGPALQVRLKHPIDGARNGSVRGIFTISGRRDAGSCNMPQPDLESEARHGNATFRIPTPLYGAGLIESISDASILANAATNTAEKKDAGIHGHPNRDPGDGTISRFGWKAQTRSLDVFAADAYQNEQGVTNELFPEEKGAPPPECLINPTPEDRKATIGRRPGDAHSNVTLVAHYMRFLAPPSPPEDPTGRDLFLRVGCGLCHTPQLTTGKSAYPALSDRHVQLYSDLLVHHMGPDLADGLTQGSAGADEFRTTPLWGVGRRLFLLHDGRTTDLNEAILAHAAKSHNKSRSEAYGVIKRYRQLSPSDHNILLRFLFSL